MKNIDFGNYLYELRNKNDLTQRAVAYELNVSDKAVSKWETGNSKPDLEKLKQLATLYNVSLNDLLDHIETKEDKQIYKIALTGGPCAGKTTALSWIDNYFSEKGYSVLFVSETATELITSGVAPWTCDTNFDFQSLQIKLQKYKEQVILEAAKKVKNDKVLIVCDRGILDTKAFIKPMEFKQILKALNTSEIKERDSYNAVFHLVTAAKGKEEAYTLANNKARTENAKQAIELDDKIIAAWTGHSHLRVIDNSTEFEEKLERLIKEISSFLGEPEPLEIERKYLIYYPNIKELDNMDNCTKVDITQIYLKSDDDTERRIRSRGIDGDYSYYLTEKRKVTDVTRVEVERRLTEKEYLELLTKSDNKLHTIHKTRYCLTINNKYYEIDIYPEWNRQAIMEIELSSEDEEVIVPDFISIYKEVTNDTKYKNYNMAKEMPKELIKE